MQMLLNKKVLVLDVTNMLFRVFHQSEYTHSASKRVDESGDGLDHEYAPANEAMSDEERIIGLAIMMAFNKLAKYCRAYKPAKIIFSFVGSGNWRKTYTKSDLCVSRRPYKGTRRQNMTDKQQQSYETFKIFAADFEHMMREHTSVVCLAGKGLEADDLVGGVCETCSEASEIVIVSADRDMLQLLQYENVRVIDPSTDKPMNLAKWDNKPELFMFEKCIRGDTGDNVMSAYPRVRQKKIWEAFEDPYKRANMMNIMWKLADPETEEEREVRVGDVFEENRLLMDLTQQPEYIRNRMFDIIHESLENPGKYSSFHMRKFLSKYKLKELSRRLESYEPYLSK